MTKAAAKPAAKTAATKRVPDETTKPSAAGVDPRNSTGNEPESDGADMRNVPVTRAETDPNKGDAVMDLSNAGHTPNVATGAENRALSEANQHLVPAGTRPNGGTAREGVVDDEPKPRKKGKKEEEMVSVTVPRAFRLTADDGEVIEFREGVQDMPRRHAEHRYSEANGVEINE